jgi:drug/metabolite transporter (DMT)-like permease
MWFIIALAGYFLLAVVFILDKLILTKSVNRPAVYTFYSTIFLFALFLALPFGVKIIPKIDLALSIVSGLAFGFGLLTLFIAVKGGESSHLSPFNGAIITIAVYVLSSLFLGEKLSNFQLLGILILVFASFLLSFEKSRKHSGMHIGFLWAAFSGLLFAVSNVIAKYIYGLYPFLTGIVWTKGTVGLVALICLFSPAVRSLFKHQKKNETGKNFAKKNATIIVASNKILSIVSNVLLQYAMAIGSVTLVNALSGLQFGMMFIMIYLLTVFTPKIFNEYFTKRELAVEITALVLVIIGSAFFVL